MSRDYKTTASSQKGNKEKLYNILPSWAWMLLGIFLGLISSSIVFWKYQNTPKPKATPQVLTSPAAGQRSKSGRFDFYRVLPTMKDEDITSVEKEASPKKEHYIIQAGSFRQIIQAQELKAQLALLGHEASIQTIKITSQDIWYRVYLGPFESRDKALLAQKQLEKAHPIHSLVLKST